MHRAVRQAQTKTTKDYAVSKKPTTIRITIKNNTTTHLNQSIVIFWTCLFTNHITINIKMSTTNQYVHCMFSLAYDAMNFVKKFYKLFVDNKSNMFDWNVKQIILPIHQSFVTQNEVTTRNVCIFSWNLLRIYRYLSCQSRTNFKLSEKMANIFK